MPPSALATLMSNRRTKLGWHQVFEDYGWLCVYCLAPATTVDHVVPLAFGGNSHPDNLVPACFGCNNRKGAMPLIIFLAHFKLDPTGYARIERPAAPPPPPLKFSLEAAFERALLVARRTHPDARHGVIRSPGLEIDFGKKKEP